MTDDPSRAWAVQFTRTARKELRAIDTTARRRIIDALEALAVDPGAAANVVPMKGEDAFRLRVGDYRAVYMLDGDALVVLVVRVAHRKEAYR